MKTLDTFIQEIRNQYQGQWSIIVAAEQLRMQDDGTVNTGENDFRLAKDALERFPHLAGVPFGFYAEMPQDLQAIIFNRMYKKRLDQKYLQSNIRLTLNQNNEIIGYDDPTLFKINPIVFMDIFCDSIPKTLMTQPIEISRLSLSSTIVSFSCFSPQIVSEPVPGDVINAGIDIHHSNTGEFGTQYRCYFQRLVCKNGATTHICTNQKNLRIRRLSNGSFDMADMIRQNRHLLTEAWNQLQTKLDTIKRLQEEQRMPLEFLDQQRTRFSLNNDVLKSIKHAITEDELGQTKSNYDIFNAISRVASHDPLSIRQQRRLMYMAGELSQRHTHVCPHCGSWISNMN